MSQGAHDAGTCLPWFPPGQWVCTGTTRRLRSIVYFTPLVLPPRPGALTASAFGGVAAATSSCPLTRHSSRHTRGGSTFNSVSSGPAHHVLKIAGSSGPRLSCNHQLGSPADVPSFPLRRRSSRVEAFYSFTGSEPNCQPLSAARTHPPPLLPRLPVPALHFACSVGM